MDQMTFEIVKLVLTLVITFLFGLITKELIPWLREKLGNEKMQTIESAARKFVLATQQQCWQKTGSERRAIVTEKIKALLISKNIEMTDEQIRDLLEAAVKAMNIDENASVTIATTEVRQE